MKIVVADDHAVMRQALKALLGGMNGFEVVGEAKDGLELMPLVERESPDVVILDLSMPNLGGIETIARLRRVVNSPTVLVLSAREDDQSVREAIKAGAKGYLPKSVDAGELEFALRSVVNGDSYLSPKVCGAMMRPESNAESQVGLLSQREREVMKLLCEGQPNREIANKLHISARTVDTHRANIMKKLAVKSNAELVQLAIKFGVIEPRA
ncbi:response regulator transcription factor [bacterium]|nr:response regulator transcription factor [bacterium]